MQERRTRTAWQDIPDFPAPPVLRAGTVRQQRPTTGDGSPVHYVVEPLVLGRHPFSPGARFEAALDLLPSLIRSWRTYGPVDRPLSDVFDTRLLRRLWPILGEPGMTDELPSLSRLQLYRHVWWLVRRNRSLPFVPGHGDMVSTNIIRTPGGRHILVDWEHGREMPIGQGGDRYRWNEQLALGVCRLLTWSSDRRDRAHAAGRGQQFDTDRVAQVRLLAELLDEPVS